MGRQWEGERGKEKRVIKGKGRGDGWKGETVGRRRKEKRVVKGKRREDGWWGRTWEGGKMGRRRAKGEKGVGGKEEKELEKRHYGVLGEGRQRKREEIERKREWEGGAEERKMWMAWRGRGILHS
jgi:hypothetical protein